MAFYDVVKDRNYFELEENVLMAVKDEMSKTDNKDTINKLYRQARIWVRFHCLYAGACSKEDASILNERFKEIRRNRVDEISRGENYEK